MDLCELRKTLIRSLVGEVRTYHNLGFEPRADTYEALDFLDPGAKVRCSADFGSHSGYSRDYAAPPLEEVADVARQVREANAKRGGE
jgi:hypothetical protein